MTYGTSRDGSKLTTESYCRVDIDLVASKQDILDHTYCIHDALGLKGIVHPKMEILSSFTHPQEVPNLYEFLCSAEHKGRYSEESL